MQKFKIKTVCDQNIEETFLYIWDLIDLKKYDSIQECLADTSDGYHPVIGWEMIIPAIGHIDPDIAQVVNTYLDNSDKDIIIDLVWDGTVLFTTNYEFGSSRFDEHYRNGRFKFISQCDQGILRLDREMFNLISDFNQAKSASVYDQYYELEEKPYTFLSLNGHSRQENCRTQMIEQLGEKKLLDNALWSFQKSVVEKHPERKVLPGKYEDDFFEIPQPSWSAINDNYFRLDLGNRSTMINDKLFVDTYFSVIAETWFYSDVIDITEKTWKAILVGHPFVILSSPGLYKELHNRGYKTFNGLIDESFDSIEDHDLRLKHAVDSISELCQSDLKKFMQEARPICEHNRMLMLEQFGKRSTIMRERWKPVLRKYFNA